VTPKQAEEINLAKDLGKISLSLRSLATKKKAAATPADVAGTAAEPESLDDILKANEALSEEHKENLTRDTEVSKIISPLESAGGQVVVIRGNERATVQFGPEAAAPNAQ
jgi:stalled ribosome rescue protein Dom34